MSCSCVPTPSSSSCSREKNRKNKFAQNHSHSSTNASCSEEIFLGRFYSENPLGNHILLTVLSCLSGCKPIYIVHRIKQTQAPILIENSGWVAEWIDREVYFVLRIWLTWSNKPLSKQSRWMGRAILWNSLIYGG